MINLHDETPGLRFIKDVIEFAATFPFNWEVNEPDSFLPVRFAHAKMVPRFQLTLVVETVETS